VSIPPGLRVIKTIGLPLLARARDLVTRIFPYQTTIALQVSDNLRHLEGALTDLLCEYRASGLILFLAGPSFNVSKWITGLPDRMCMIDATSTTRPGWPVSLAVDSTIESRRLVRR